MSASERLSESGGNWEALPLIMVRMPLLPRNEFRDAAGHSAKLVAGLWSHPVLRESVWQSNPSVAAELDKIADGAPTSEKKLHRLRLTLLKYSIRANGPATLKVR